MLLCLLSGGPPSASANQCRAARGIIMTYCSYDTEYHGVWVCNSFHYRASRSSSDGGENAPFGLANDSRAGEPRFPVAALAAATRSPQRSPDPLSRTTGGSTRRTTGRARALVGGVQEPGYGHVSLLLSQQPSSRAHGCE